MEEKWVNLKIHWNFKCIVNDTLVNKVMEPSKWVCGYKYNHVVDLNKESLTFEEYLCHKHNFRTIITMW